MGNYSILVNTCDKFEDCWSPFFILKQKYWDDCSAQVYLNTERKDCAKEFDAIPLKVCEYGKVPAGERPSWSACLKWALEQIPTDIVMYLQEDYFLKDRVDNAAVERYVDLMLDHPEIKCLHLTDQAVKRDGPSEFDGLDNVLLVQAYRVSCQAALWRKDELLKLIDVTENPWEFEHFSSMRSSAYAHKYLVVSQETVTLGKKEILPYVFTGIIKGKWKDEVEDLFRDNGIDIDFSIRGWYDPQTVLPGRPDPTIRKRLSNRLKCEMIKLFGR